CFLTDRFELLFLRAFEIFAVGTALGFARRRIVVGLKNLMDECDHRRLNLPRAPTVLIARKKTEKATSIPGLGISVPFLPVLSGSGWNGCSELGRLNLFIIIVMLRVNHAITEDGCGNIRIAGVFQEFSTFWGNA